MHDLRLQHFEASAGRQGWRHEVCSKRAQLSSAVLGKGEAQAAKSWAGLELGAHLGQVLVPALVAQQLGCRLQISGAGWRLACHCSSMDVDSQVRSSCIHMSSKAKPQGGSAPCPEGLAGLAGHSPLASNPEQTPLPGHQGKCPRILVEALANHKQLQDNTGCWPRNKTHLARACCCSVPCPVPEACCSTLIALAKLTPGGRSTMTAMSEASEAAEEDCWSRCRPAAAIGRVLLVAMA